MGKRWHFIGSLMNTVTNYKHVFSNLWQMHEMHCQFLAKWIIADGCGFWMLASFFPLYILCYIDESHYDWSAIIFISICFFLLSFYYIWILFNVRRYKSLRNRTEIREICLCNFFFLLINRSLYSLQSIDSTMKSKVRYWFHYIQYSYKNDNICNRIHWGKETRHIIR